MKSTKTKFLCDYCGGYELEIGESTGSYPMSGTPLEYSALSVNWQKTAKDGGDVAFTICGPCIKLAFDRVLLPLYGGTAKGVDLCETQRDDD